VLAIGDYLVQNPEPALGVTTGRHPACGVPELAQNI